MSGLTILYRMTGNSQNFARIKLGIKLISDSVACNCGVLYCMTINDTNIFSKCFKFQDAGSILNVGFVQSK